MTEKLTELFSKARKDLNIYRQSIQLYDAEQSEKLKPAPFHKQWSDELLFGTQSIAVEAFRESGKSSIIKAFLLYVLTFPKKDLCYIAIMRGNKTAASKILKEISAEYQRNIFTCHSIKTVLEDSEEAFCVETYNGVIVRIEAYGKGSAIRGASYNNRRPDVVVLDDIQDKEDMRSPTIPDTDWDWFLSDIKFLGRNTRFFMIGNNLGDKCIIERLINTADPDGIGLFGFKCYRIPAIIGDKPTWQERFDIDFLNKEMEEMRKQGKLDIWLMERMCVSVSDENRVFLKDDFRYYCQQQEPEILEESRLYLFSDLASSTESTADYRVLMVIAVTPQDYWHIIECKYGRWQSTEYLDIMFDLIRKYSDYGLSSAHLEDGQILQTLMPIIKLKQAQESTYFTVKPIKQPNDRSKEARIQLLQPRFRANTIWFKQDAEYLPELEKELLSFTMDGTKSLHDDLIDTLANAVPICVKPVKKSASKCLQSQSQQSDGRML